MAFVIADRVKERTTTTGTGTVTLTGAATGFQSFSAIGNANTTYYAIVSQTGTEWEVGLGTYTSSGTTLARTTVIASSNAGSAVNFSAGTKDVFVTYPSGRAVLANSSLTSGRVPYATTSGFLTDSANLTFSGTILTAAGFAGPINGTVGATTASTGAFTSITASTTITATGAGSIEGLTVGRGAGAVATNTAVGNNALVQNSTGAFSTAVGREAGFSTLTSDYNTFVGYRAGYNTTGGQNTFLGKFAGNSVTSGATNTIVGAFNGNQGGLDIRTSSNYTVISDGGGTPHLAAYAGGTVALQGAIPNAGTGITFPATQSNSSNANTLDDYEEGSWTPIVTATGVSGVAYSRQVGYYTKIGNAVSIMFTADLSSKGTGGSGQIGISPLPFVPGTYGANLNADYSILVDNLDAARYQCHIQILQSDTTAGLIASGSTTGSHAGLTWAQIGNSSVFRCGLTYLSV